MADIDSKVICGLVMPISPIDGLSESHWAEVLAVLSDAIEKAGFVANLVSNADDVGIIQKRIIQNLYDNPIVVCDVSAKNPNVMFELGVRLAFDKPTIIVKDDKTTYSFDTSPIEHVTYPRDLRYAQIVEFKDKLAEKIRGTHAKASTDPNYTTFLKNFGEFTVAKLDKKEVSGQEFILEELKALRASIQRLDRPSDIGATRKRPETFAYAFSKLSNLKRSEISSFVGELPYIQRADWRDAGSHTLVNVTGSIAAGSIPDSNKRATRRFIANDLPVPGPATTRIRAFAEAAISYAGVPLIKPSDQGILMHPKLYQV